MSCAPVTTVVGGGENELNGWRAHRLARVVGMVQRLNTVAGMAYRLPTMVGAGENELPGLRAWGSASSLG